MISILPYYETAHQILVAIFFCVIVVGIYVAAWAFRTKWELVTAFLSGFLAFLMFFGAWYYPQDIFTGHEQAVEFGLWMIAIMGISLIFNLGRKFAKRWTGLKQSLT